MAGPENQGICKNFVRLSFKTGTEDESLDFLMFKGSINLIAHMRKTHKNKIESFGTARAFVPGDQASLV